MQSAQADMTFSIARTSVRSGEPILPCIAPDRRSPCRPRIGWRLPHSCSATRKGYMDLRSIHLRLSDLNDLVAEVLDQAFPGPFWVIAEVAEAKTAGAAGHTYLDLVEKRGDEVVAQA